MGMAVFLEANILGFDCMCIFSIFLLCNDNLFFIMLSSFFLHELICYSQLCMNTRYLHKESSGTSIHLINGGM